MSHYFVCRAAFQFHRCSKINQPVSQIFLVDTSPHFYLLCLEPFLSYPPLGCVLNSRFTMCLFAGSKNDKIIGHYLCRRIIAWSFRIWTSLVVNVGYAKQLFALFCNYLFPYGSYVGLFRLLYALAGPIKCQLQTWIYFLFAAGFLYAVHHLCGLRLDSLEYRRSRSPWPLLRRRADLAPFWQWTDVNLSF